MTKHERKIKNILYDLMITPEIKGYHYLFEAITIKENANKIKDSHKSQMKIYRAVADRFHTTPSSVERAIRYAIKRSSNNKTPLFLTIFEPALNIYKETKPITNSRFIAMVTEHIASQETGN